MAHSSLNQELVEKFVHFYRNYYRDDISRLAQRYPNEQRSLYVDYGDLYEFDQDLAFDFLHQPDQIGDFAEEALRVYDLPADVSLGQAHVRLQNLPDTVDIDSIRMHDNHIGRMIAVSGVIREATDVQPEITEAAFECQRCGTMTYIPQTGHDFEEPPECQGCERQGPYRINYDQSEFVDAQTLTVVDTDAATGEGYQNSAIDDQPSIQVSVEDDLAGQHTKGDFVTVTGVLHIVDQNPGQRRTSRVELRLDGVSIVRSENEFVEEWIAASSATVDAEALETFAERSTAILATQADRLNEWTTQMKIITPFLDALGWDIHGPHVVAEKPAPGMSNNKADYVLYDADDTPAVLVEAKQSGTSLDTAVEQLRKYLRLYEVDRGILTNGERFRFYLRNQEQQIGEFLYLEAAVGKLPARSAKLQPFTPAGVGVEELEAFSDDTADAEKE